MKAMEGITRDGSDLLKCVSTNSIHIEKSSDDEEDVMRGC